LWEKLLEGVLSRIEDGNIDGYLDGVLDLDGEQLDLMDGDTVVTFLVGERFTNYLIHFVKNSFIFV